MERCPRRRIRLRRVLLPGKLSLPRSVAKIACHVEAFWRTMEHQWLFLNTLDSVAAVRRHVSTYVAALNG